MREEPEDPSQGQLREAGALRPVPVEYRKSDELDQSSHNWEANTRARAPSSPGNEESGDPDDDELTSRPSEQRGGVSKFQLMVESSTIAAVYGKSIWGRVSLKVQWPASSPS
jgi:hypothetical protein